MKQFRYYRLRIFRATRGGAGMIMYSTPMFSKIVASRGSAAQIQTVPEWRRPYRPPSQHANYGGGQHAFAISHVMAPIATVAVVNTPPMKIIAVTCIGVLNSWSQIMPMNAATEARISISSRLPLKTLPVLKGSTNTADSPQQQAVDINKYI